MTTTSLRTSFFSWRVTLIVVRPPTAWVVLSKPIYEKISEEEAGTLMVYLPSISVMLPATSFPALAILTVTPIRGSPPGSVTVPDTFTCWANAASSTNISKAKSTNRHLKSFLSFGLMLKILVDCIYIVTVFRILCKDSELYDTLS